MSASVYFFGGFLASPTDMKVWLGSARAQKSDSDIVFDAYPWPSGANFGAKSAISTFTNSGQYDKALAAIKACKADRIYIVGHSSGCAIANHVERNLDDHDKIWLVALDGFVPDGNQRGRSNTQVWAAVCGDAKSLHHDDLKGVVGADLKVYQATNCKTKWALHFSLVNANATDSAVTSIDKGYVNCRANLAWLSN
jgi:hypothetical protein